MDVVWAFPQLLVGSGAAWQAALAQHSPAAVFTITALLAHELPWVSLNVFFYVLDHFQWLQQYHLPRREFPSRALILRCLAEAAPSHLLLSPLMLYYLVAPLFQRFNSFVPTASPATAAAQLLLMLVLADTAFYWCHRALHTPLLYRFHKQHHQFRATVGIAAEYSHPVEYLLTGALPTVLIPTLVGCDLWVFLVFMVLRIWETTETHSGYELPWSPWRLFAWQGGARQHDFHHSHNVGNYGGLFSVFWDRVCGTDTAYREYLAREKVRFVVEQPQRPAWGGQGGKKDS